MKAREVFELLKQERQRAKLTDQQQQICALITGGETIRGIALVFKLSPKTVEYHRAKIYERLGINDLVTLTKWALRCGLTTL